jgi:uncharacterized membrane protein YgdD (TMEM256/DUF423 family)
MDQREHRTVGEGLLTGVVGAVVAAVWYLIMDTAAGRPFATPNVLGQVFVRGDTMPGLHVVPQAVVEYTLLHFVVFAVLGIGLVWITHLASRNPSLRMGVWLGLVIGFLLFLGHLLMLANLTRQRLPWAAAIGGSILGFGAMGFLLWRRHPGLRGSFDRAPLGAEVKPPPHPPGVPRR